MIEGTEGFARLGNLDSLNSKEKANASFGQMKEGSKKSELKTVIPLQRVGYGRDISDAALFLASDAGSYVSGSSIVVDGGSSLVYPNFPFAAPGFVEMWS